jgi:hypothetical protein
VAGDALSGAAKTQGVRQMRIIPMRRTIIFLLALIPELSLAQTYEHKFSVDCTKLVVGLIGIEYSQVDDRLNQEINFPVLFLTGGPENWIRKNTDLTSVYMIGFNYRRIID